MATREENNKPNIEPLYRWVGGKRKLLVQILPHIPQKYGTYYEPFFGGGALFFSISHTKAVVGDTNPELINFLQVVKANPNLLIEALYNLSNSEQDYYEMRSASPRSGIQRAARFLYLTNLSFNGIYRVNKHGVFNVPYCKDPSRRFFSKEMILLAHKKLKNTDIILGDFADTIKSAKPGDLVYFDPPYTVAHDNNGFLEYNESIFQWEDQIKLSNIARQLAKNGINVIISNANHHTIKALYDMKNIYFLDRASTISGIGIKRRKVREILIVYK